MITHFIPSLRSRSSRVVSFIAMCVAAALLTGCAGINRLREAQEAFNEAAAAENMARFDANPADAVATLGSVRSGYASALLSLRKLEREGDESTLRNDGLWGTALTLKALCHWRLGQYEQALSAAHEAQATAGDQIYPRDLAVLQALPGLIKTDQAYELIVSADGANTNVLADAEELLVGSRGAVADIQRAREKVDRTHPVQIYLLQAQLAAYRNYSVALKRFLSPTTTVPATHPARTNANAQLKELHESLARESPQSGVELILYWTRLTGLGVPR